VHVVTISRVPTRCRHCKEKFTTEEKEKRLRIHNFCIDDFLAALKAKKERVQERERKAKQRVERALDRKKREEQKPRSKWLDECQAIVNKIVRLRDRHLPCCSCDRPASWDGQWHASHLRSVGAASAVRFHLWNIHKGCSICNHHLSGNIAGYTPRLVEKIGQDKVDWLYTQNHVVKHDIPYLMRFKSVMGKRLRRLEKRMA
jgi:hypothetical protein